MLTFSNLIRKKTIKTIITVQFFSLNVVFLLTQREERPLYMYGLNMAYQMFLDHRLSSILHANLDFHVEMDMTYLSFNPVK